MKVLLLTSDENFVIIRDHFVYVPSQREMRLQCNLISHWLCAYTKWSLIIHKMIPDHNAYTKWSLIITHTKWSLIITHAQNDPWPYHIHIMIPDHMTYTKRSLIITHTQNDPWSQPIHKMIPDHKKVSISLRWPISPPDLKTNPKNRSTSPNPALTTNDRQSKEINIIPLDWSWEELEQNGVVYQLIDLFQKYDFPLNMAYLYFGLKPLWWNDF